MVDPFRSFQRCYSCLPIRSNAQKYILTLFAVHYGKQNDDAELSGIGSDNKSTSCLEIDHIFIANKSVMAI
jgi:hypothetical protein